MHIARSSTHKNVHRCRKGSWQRSSMSVFRCSRLVSSVRTRLASNCWIEVLQCDRQSDRSSTSMKLNGVYCRLVVRWCICRFLSRRKVNPSRSATRRSVLCWALYWSWDRTTSVCVPRVPRIDSTKFTRSTQYASPCPPLYVIRLTAPASDCSLKEHRRLFSRSQCVRPCIFS